MKGLSSTEFAKQTNFAQAMPPSLLVRSAASLIIIPTWRTASILMPARVVATLTEEHKRFVVDCSREFKGVAARAFSNHRHRCDRNSLIGDPDPEFVAYRVYGFNQTVGEAMNFLHYTFAGARD